MNGKDDPGKPHGSFAKNKKAVEKYTSPKTLTEELATHLQEYAQAAPGITAGMNTAVMRAQQFLQSKIPQASTSLPLSAEFRPSRTSMHKFNSYYETVHDPVSVLSHVKMGTLRNEHLEALSTVYPHLYDEMKKKVVENMDPEKARSLPYGTKIAIAKFMGQPLDSSMLPQSIMQNQAALTGPRLGSQGAAQGGKTTLGGLKELNSDKRAATETDRLEEDTD